MTENDKKALLRDINGIGKIWQQARYLKLDIAENILVLDSNETRLNAANTQIKLQELMNNLHELVHCYIKEADQEGYEVVWKDFEALELRKKKDEKGEKENEK